MRKKTKFLIAIAVVLGIMLVSAVSIMAATSYGTQSDPLITRSYLMQIFRPEVISEVNGSVGTAQANLAATFSDSIRAINSKLDGGGNASKTDVFSVVTLSSGQTVTCNAGTEIILRSGSASATGDTYPQLADTTDGTSLSSGSGLSVNHMYMITADGNGFKAEGDSTKILIRGDYTIS